MCVLYHRIAKKPPASVHTARPPCAEKGLVPVSNFRQKYLTNIWNVPNVLTMVRLALIPVFVLLHAFYLHLDDFLDFMAV